MKSFSLNGHKIEELRADKEPEMTQKALAEASGIDQSTLSKLIGGKARTTKTTAVKIAQALGVAAESIIEMEAVEPRNDISEAGLQPYIRKLSALYSVKDDPELGRWWIGIEANMDAMYEAMVKRRRGSERSTRAGLAFAARRPVTMPRPLRLVWDRETMAAD